MNRWMGCCAALVLAGGVAASLAAAPPQLLPAGPVAPAPANGPPFPVQPGGAPPGEDEMPPAAVPPGFSRLMTELVREYLPHEYVDDRHWGLKKEVQSGLKIFMDQGRPTTRRTFKEVNHGTWTRARFELVDPERDFDVHVLAVKGNADGQPEMDLLVTSRIRFEARLSRWQWGVQLVSLSAEGTARIELRMTCAMPLTLDLHKLPPDVILRPTIRTAELKATEYRVHKVSKVGGEFAEQVGRLSEGILKRKLAEQGERLPEKLNKKIAANPERWRLSLADAAAAGWETLLGDKGGSAPPTGNR